MSKVKLSTLTKKMKRSGKAGTKAKALRLAKTKKLDTKIKRRNR